MRDIFEHIFYFFYILTSVRFFLHTGILAFPIPKPKKYKRLPLDESDQILIQYPIRNEPKWAIERFVKSLYTIPLEQRKRFTIQFLDDYDGEGMPWRFETPIKAVYLKRRERKGNKAGNLNYGLSIAPKEFKWVMIYDADHQMDGTGIIEACEILKANPIICCVQSRWVINNKKNTFLSWLQEVVLETHFDREQVFRSRYDIYPIFNGAGAVWNREIVEKECGGWLERNVCEDTDISGVMNMIGYKIHVLPEWITKTDNPTTWKSYRTQQQRWIMGNGKQIQFHIRDSRGWGWKKLYWISWNLGFALAFTKYLIPAYIAYKYYYGIPFNKIDMWGLIPHGYALIANMLAYDNALEPKKLKNILLYPLHFISEQFVLPWQIYGFWKGFFGWYKFHEFKVTRKEIK